MRFIYTTNTNNIIDEPSTKPIGLSVVIHFLRFLKPLLPAINSVHNLFSVDELSIVDYILFEPLAHYF